MIKYKPFGYQEIAIEVGIEVLTSTKPRSEVIVAPVAAGKSIIIAEIVKRLPKDGNVLIIQPNKELTEQNISKIESAGVKVSTYSASLSKKELGKITYATPGSIDVVKFKKFGFKYCCIDECDHGTKDGTKLKKNIRDIGIKNILGFTATPIYMQQTMEGSVLKIMSRTRSAMFKDICHVIQIEEIVKNKRWSQLQYIEYEFDKKGLILNSTGSDFTEESIITNYAETDAETKILSIIKTLGKERALIFVPGIENVNTLYNHLKAKGLSVGHLHSKTPKSEREHTLKCFREGVIQYLINSQILGVGYDDPSLENLIDAYPTNSARINYQKIGRIVRVGKKIGKVHCISGNYEKFGSIEDITFENVENYGWGMFVKGFLASGIPMKENIKISKEDLINNRAKKVEKTTKNKRYTTYDFEYQGDLSSDKFSFGKYQGLSVSEVYNKDRGYLSWMYKKIKEENGFSGDKHKSIRTKILELFDKKLPF